MGCWPRAVAMRSTARDSLEGGSAGWLTAHRHDLQSSRREGFLTRRNVLSRLRRRDSGAEARAFTGVGCSTRMKAPSRVRNRNFASTRAPSSAEHDAASRPHRRRACGSVSRSPGISRNSPCTRRRTSSVAGAIHHSLFTTFGLGSRGRVEQPECHGTAWDGPAELGPRTLEIQGFPRAAPHDRSDARAASPVTRVFAV